MRVDRSEVRRLAEDPDVKFMIKTIDTFFSWLYAESLPTCPELAGKAEEEAIEGYWRHVKEGTLRLYDEEVDDDFVFVAEAVTPGQRARARRVGEKLFAVRQHLRAA